MQKVQVMLGFCFTRKPKRNITRNYRCNKVQSPSNISKSNWVFKLEGWVCYNTLSISNNLIFCTRTPFLILLQRTDFKICFELFSCAQFLFWEILNLNLTFAVCRMNWWHMQKVQVMLGFCFTRKPKRNITRNYRCNKVQSPSNISKSNWVFKLEGWVCYNTLSISNNLIFCARTPFLILLQRTDFKICFELFSCAQFLFWEILNLNLTFAVYRMNWWHMRKVQVMLGFCFTRKPKRNITRNYRCNKVQSPSNISKSNWVFKLEGWVCYNTLSISNNLIFCTRTPFWYCYKELIFGQERLRPLYRR